MRHVLVALVEDKPGVLNRVASLFRRRAFNIESLTVGHTERTGVSRITIAIDTDPPSARRLVAHLYKLVNVIQVTDLADSPAVNRDLALVKVGAGAEMRAGLLRVVDETRAHVVDSGDETMTIEITGEPEYLDLVISRLRPFGVVEMVRTGLVAMARGDEALRMSNGSYARQAAVALD